MPRSPNRQADDNLAILNDARAIEDTGLLMGILDVMEARGFDVTIKAEQLMANLTGVFKRSGLTQFEIDGSKPQERISASSLNISSSAIHDVGGINLSADQTDLEIRGTAQPIEFNFDINQLQNLQFDGLVPVISNIIPVVNLPLFLSENISPAAYNQLTKVN